MEYIVVIQKDQVLRGTGNCQKVFKKKQLGARALLPNR